MRILFTGGGTGGHIFPIVAVARQLKQIYQQEEGLEMFFLGPIDPSGRKDLEKQEVKVKNIITGKFRRYFSFRIILDLIKLPIGFFQSIFYLYIWMPDVIFSKGGYGSLPTVLIGWIFSIPILIHESDTVPGLVNRISSGLAKRIAVSFAVAEKHFPGKKTALVGNPIRSRIVETCLSTDQGMINKARVHFDIASQKPVIFLCGGSQGAQKMNSLLLQSLASLLEKYEVIHQCGQKNYELVKNSFIKTKLPQGYHLLPFLDEDQMGMAYLLSNLVISRAGSSNISEIAACHKPSIIIPLPSSASNHQRENAFTYARNGAGVVLEQSNLTPNLFIGQIDKIINDQKLSREMENNARNCSRPEAAAKIAEALIEMGM